jgi:hypothetical protein
MITPTASSHGGVPTQDKAKEVPSTFNARAETAARKAMFDEPMSKSVVSFTKPTGQVTPYWLLQQMAAIDAVLTCAKFRGARLDLL